MEDTGPQIAFNVDTNYKPSRGNPKIHLDSVTHTQNIDYKKFFKNLFYSWFERKRIQSKISQRDMQRAELLQSFKHEFAWSLPVIRVHDFAGISG